MPSPAQFRKTILDYYAKHPRPMPWRLTRDPYRILVSEIMLQQTQVARVVPFYGKFIKKFPDAWALAKARTSDVLAAWQGLGYNRRALSLRKLAKKVVEEYDGRLPRGFEALVTLPGIGPYTAGAIRAFAFNEPGIFIETNIRRVFIHFFFPNRRKVTDTAIRRCIEGTLYRKNPREWYWALMDYGAMLGAGALNANRRSAHYVRQSKFAGSDREIRGKILRYILMKKKVKMAVFAEELHQSRAKMRTIIDGLARDGFIFQAGKYIELVK